MIRNSIIFKFILITMTTVITITTSQETKQNRAIRIGILRRKAIAQSLFDEYNKNNQTLIQTDKLYIDSKREIDIALNLFNSNTALLEEQLDARLPLGSIEFRRALHGWELNIYQHLIKRQSNW